MLAPVSECARHAAATGVSFLHLKTPKQHQWCPGALRATYCSLMTMTMEPRLTIPAAKPRRQPGLLIEPTQETGTQTKVALIVHQYGNTNGFAAHDWDALHGTPAAQRTAPHATWVNRQTLLKGGGGRSILVGPTQSPPGRPVFRRPFLWIVDMGQRFRRPDCPSARWPKPKVVTSMAPSF